MIRVALIALVVSTALPLTTALAQTAGEPAVAPAAPVEVVTSPVSLAAAVIDREWVDPPNPIIVTTAPVETAPASPPATAPVTSPIVTAPTPVEPASAEPPAAVPVTLPLPVSAPSAAAAPDASPASPSAKRRTATKPPKSRAPTSVTLVNDREIPATTVTVLSDAQSVIYAGPLAPKAQSTLTLPKLKGCLVTVEATFEAGSVSDGSAIDVCRVKLVRLTD